MSAPEQTTPLQYFSSFSHGIDEKRRAQVPAAWRPESEGTKLTLMVWSKHKAGTCLRVLPAHELAKIVATIDALPKGDASKGALQRLIGRDSVQVTLDKAGRIILPDAFAKAADLRDEALFVGCIHHFEIWNPARHENAKAIDDAIAPQALDLLD